MMKESYIYRFKILLLLIFCVLMTSCSKKDVNKITNVVLVAGVHSNSAKMDKFSDEDIIELFSGLGKIRIIVADGNPEFVDGTGEHIFDDQYLKRSQEAERDNNPLWKSNFLPELNRLFTEEYKKLEPDDPEVDTLRAIFKAVGTLNDISNDKENKKIIIYDTGLSTSGEFSFAKEEWKSMLFDEELKDEKIQDMVVTLERKDLIPDLSDTEVIWHGIGNTAGKQEILENRYLTNLKRIWHGILKASKAIPPSKKGEYDYFFSGSSYDETNYSLEVTPITNDESTTGTLKSKKISAKKLGFKSESSEFISEKKAIKVLKPYAKDIQDCPDENILLIGTTADPKRNGGSLALSKRRAVKVKKYLVKLGVPDNRMKIYGWGARSSLYDSGEWVGNSFKEKIAKKNRAVHLIPENSEDAQKLLRQEHP